MSISFSGLASGLDTSSWVKSLTALKQAKVTTLQEQRENVLLSRNTLNSIKSFFTSFRSLLERVTDTRFNIASMDLFAQNIATSAKPSVVTATATPEAQEGKYEVKVDKLASNTQATSKYNYQTVKRETSIATNDSRLSTLGVKSGDILVEVGGVEYGITIEEKETIGSFAQKLRDLGVSANFNDSTGIFSMNISAGDITDIGTTGIVNGLHLSAENKGYSSGSLTYEKVETSEKLADGGTALSELGVNTGTIVMNANGSQYDVIIEEGDSIQDLINALDTQGIDAKIENGVFTISNAVILNEGTTGIINALGLTSPEISSNTQWSESLAYQTTVTTTETATLDTELSDLGVEINDNDKIVVKDSASQLHTITLQSTSTIRDVISGLNSAGLRASINSDGQVLIEKGEILTDESTYDVLDAFDITTSVEDNRTFTVNGTSNILSTGSETTAGRSTTLDSLGIEADDVLNLHDKDGNITSSHSNLQDLTIDELFDLIENNSNIEASIQNGVITLTSPTGEYITGEIADALGIATSVVTTTISSTQSSSGSGNVYQQTVTADENTSLADLGLVGKTYEILNSDGTTVLTSTTENTTLGELFGAWKTNHNFNATITDGIISIDNSTGMYLTGELADALGITSNSFNGGTVTTGTDITSTAPATYTETTTTTEPITNTVVTGGGNSSGTEVTVPSTTTSVETTYTTTTVGGTETSTAPVTYTETTTTVSETETTVTNGVGNTSTIPVTYNTETTTVETTYTTSTVNGTETSTAPVTYTETTTTVETTGTTTTEGVGNTSTIPVTYNTETTTVETTYTTTTVGGTETSTATVTYTESTTNTVTDTTTTTAGVTDTSSEAVTYTVGGTTTETVYTTTTTGETVTSTLPVTYTENTTETTTTYITTTSATTQTSSQAITYQKEYAITGDTKLGDFLDLSDTSFTYTDSSGAVTNYNLATLAGSAANASNLSVSEFLDLLPQGSATLSDDGVITINAEGAYAGSIFEQLGIEVVTTETIVTTGTVMTSPEAITFASARVEMTTVLVTATADATFGALGFTTNVTGTVYDKDGNALTTLEYTTADTLSTFINDLSTYADVTLENGYISINVKSQYQGAYFEGTVFDELGITSTSTPEVVTTIYNGTTTPIVSSEAITYYSVTPEYTVTTTAAATLDTTFGELGLADKSLTIYNKNNQRIASLAFHPERTLRDFQNTLSAHSITATLTDGVFSFSSDCYNYIAGDLANALGVEAIEFTPTVEITMTLGVETGSSSAITYKDYNVPLGVYEIAKASGVSGTIPAANATLDSSGNVVVIDAAGAAANGTIINITTDAELALMNGKSYSGVTINLANDVNVSGNWTGITLTNSTFNGYGHTINFARAYFQGTNINSTNYLGFIASANSSTITEIRTSGYITANANFAKGINHVGTILGKGENVVLNNTYTNSTLRVMGTSTATISVGATIGQLVSGSVTGNESSGMIAINSCARAYIGGIAGTVTAGYVRCNMSSGIIDGAGNNLCIGGIVGKQTLGDTSYNYVKIANSAINSSGQSYVGCLIGQASGGSGSYNLCERYDSTIGVVGNGITAFTATSINNPAVASQIAIQQQGWNNNTGGFWDLTGNMPILKRNYYQQANGNVEEVVDLYNSETHRSVGCITITGNTTVNELVDMLNAAGLETSIDRTTGKLSIANGYIAGANTSMIASLATEYKSNGLMGMATAGTLTSTTTTINYDTTFGDLGASTNSVMTVMNNGTAHTFTINSSTTMNELGAFLAENYIGLTISPNGKVHFKLKNNKCYIQGDSEGYLTSLLKITSPTYIVPTITNTAQQTIYPDTIIGVKDLGNLNTATVTTTVDGSTSLEDLGLEGLSYKVVNSNNTTISLTATGTVDDLVRDLNNAGITASFENETLNIEYDMHTKISGDLITALGLNSGLYEYEKHTITSTAGITYTKDLGNITLNSRVGDVFDLTDPSINTHYQGSNNNVNLASLAQNTYNKDLADCTVDELFSLIENATNNQYSFSINNGKITLTNNYTKNNHYVVTGSVIDQFGLGSIHSSTTGIRATSTSYVTYKDTYLDRVELVSDSGEYELQYLNRDTALGATGLVTEDKYIKIRLAKGLTVTKLTITVTTTTTAQEIADKINSRMNTYFNNAGSVRVVKSEYGTYFDFKDVAADVKFTNNEAFIGDVLGLEMDVIYGNDKSSNLKKSDYFAEPVDGTTEIRDLNTHLYELGCYADDYTISMYKYNAATGEKVLRDYTFNSDSTINDILVALDFEMTTVTTPQGMTGGECYEGMDATISNGKISLIGDKNRYISNINNELATALGLDFTWNYVTLSENGTKEIFGAIGDICTSTTTRYLSSDTRFGALGLSGFSQIVTSTNKTIAVTSTSTFQDVQNALSTEGINLSIITDYSLLSGKKAQLTYDSGCYIKSASSGIFECLKISTSYATNYSVVETSTSEDALTATATMTVSGASTLADLGVTTNGSRNYLLLRDTGRPVLQVGAPLDYTTDMTIDTLAENLSSLGINLTIDNAGKISIESTGDYVLVGLGNQLQSAFNMDKGGTSTDFYSFTLNRSANLSIDDSTVTIDYTDSTLTFEDLGIRQNSYLIFENNSGQSYTANIATTDQLYTYLNGLVSSGYIDSYQITDGILSFAQNDSYHLKAIGYNASEVLGLSNTSGLYSTEDAIYKTVTNSNTLTASNINTVAESSTLITATLDTTLEDLGIESGNISLSDGTNIGYDPSGDMTLGSVLASLSETNALTYSFNNGTLTLTQTDSNVYIVSDSSNLFEKLNIDIEDFYAETTSTTPAVSTVGDSNRLQVNVEVEDTVYRPETISVNTTIEALELDSENGTITLSNGQTINYTNSTSLQNIINELQSKGSISMTLTDGVVSIDETNGCVITGDSGGLLERFGIDYSTGYSSSNITIYNNTTTDIDDLGNYTLTHSLTEDTTLADLNISGSNVIQVYNGTSYVTTTMSSGTIGELVEWLNSNHITASISDGKLNLTGATNGAYIYSMTEALANSLKLGSEFYSTDVDENIIESGGVVTKYMERDTLVTALNSATVGNTISINGVANEFTVQNTTTVGDIVDWLTTNGVETTVDNGMITIENTGDRYITSISSTLAETLGISSSAKHSNTTTSSTTNTIPTTVTETLNENTTFGKLSGNDSFNETVTVISNGSEATYTITKDTKLSDFTSWLDTKGFDVELSDGKLTITGNENAYYTDMNDTVRNLLNLTKDAGYTTDVNTTTDTTTSTNACTLVDDTKLGAIGYNSTETVTVISNGTTYTTTINSATKAGDLASWINGIDGMNASIQDGKFTISGSENAYLVGFSDSLNNALKLDDMTNTTNTTSSSTTTPITITETLNANTTFAQLNLAGQEVVTVISNGTEKTYTINKDTTSDSVGEFITWMQNQGFEASISDGKITITGNSNAYYTDLNDNVENALGLQNITGYTTTEHAANSTVTITNTYTMDENTTFSQLGFTTGQTETATIVVNGTTLTTTLTEDTKVGDFANWLRQDGDGFDVSITDGRITISGEGKNAYTTGFNDNISNILRLNDNFTGSEDVDTSTSTVPTTVTSTLDANTTFAQLNLAGQEIVTVISNGTEKTYTINKDTTSDSVGEFITWMQNQGFEASISDGKVTITGNSNAYYTDLNDNVENALGLQNITGYTTSVVGGSETLTISNTHTMDENTTFGQLGFTTGQTETATIVVNGTTLTTTLTEDTKVGDFADWLRQDGNGFNVSISEGKISIQGEENVYTNGFNTNITNALKLDNSFGNSEDVTTITTTHTIASTKTIDTNSTFAELGFDENQTEEFVVYNNSTERTITVKATDTVGSFMAQMTNAGFSVSLHNGIFNISGKENIYYNEMSDAIETALNMNTTVTNSTVENSGTQEVVTNTIRTVTADTTFAQMGIENDMTINIHANNDSSSLIISPDMSVQALLNMLNSKGFTTSIDANGVVTIEGNEGVYIEGMSSSLRNALNLPLVYAGGTGDSAAYTEETLTGYQNSTSNLLTFETPTAITEGTKLKDIEGFTALGGLAIQNPDGSTTTLTSTEESTLGELFNELSNYGITGSVDANGKVNFTSNGAQTLISTDNTSGSLLDTLEIGAATYDISTKTVMTESSPINVTPINPADENSKLGSIKDANGNTPSDYVIGVNGNEVTLDAESTIDDVINVLEGAGLDVTIDENGNISVVGTSEFTLSGGLADALFGVDREAIITGTITTTYTGDSLSVVETVISNATIDNNTLLTKINSNITTGQFFIYENGVRNVCNIGEYETLGSFRESIESFGLKTNLVNTADGVKLLVKGNGNSYIASSSASNASNVVDILFQDGKTSSYDYSNTLTIDTTVTSVVTATEDTLVKQFDTDWGDGTLASAGTLAVNVGGENHTITIGAGETFGSLMEKFEEIGVNATLGEDGTLKLYTGDKDLTITNETSSLMTNLSLTYDEDLGGYTASTESIESTIETTLDIEGSVAEFADINTKISLLNITSGSFTVYKNGEKAEIQIDNEKTFEDIQSKITQAFGDVYIRFADGFLEFYSTDENAEINVGSSVDTSNISAICGFRGTEDKTAISSRELYKVNGSSILINNDLFKRGDITEGTFTIGNAVFTIDDKTTLSSLISQINSSQEANATAFWDSVDGKFVIKSRTTGASLINIEAGTSNFTDIMGFTNSEWNDDGSLKVTKLDGKAQEIGESAQFSINGTEFTSTSNTITSDISRIQGLTLNLKDVSNGETVTITVEKDSETVADAMVDIVDAYNTLIENVDKEIAMTGQLHDQTSLKLLRNQIRSLMTSSFAGNATFKNFDAIGISTKTATANDVSTQNINMLHFDKEKFINAYKTDSEALKQILVGTENNLGILSRVENVVEQALSTGYGYFSSADNSFSREIQSLDNKITKQLAAVERYRTRLEKKFNAMDMLISQMQNQYSSFLGT